MKQPLVPCTKTCKDRTMTCHTYCKDYLQFAELQEAYRNFVAKVRSAERQLTDAEIKRRKRK